MECCGMLSWWLPAWVSVRFIRRSKVTMTPLLLETRIQKGKIERILTWWQLWILRSKSSRGRKRWERRDRHTMKGSRKLSSWERLGIVARVTASAMPSLWLTTSTLWEKVKRIDRSLRRERRQQWMILSLTHLLGLKLKLLSSALFTACKLNQWKRCTICASSFTRWCLRTCF